MELCGVLVGRGQVGGHAGLGLARVGEGEIRRYLGLGAQVEVPAGGSMAVLMPVEMGP